MTTFTYVIQDPLGIHARPAGQLAKTAATFADCDIKVSANGQTADAKRTGPQMSPDSAPEIEIKKFD